MTAETASQSVRINEAAQGVFKIGGRLGPMARGEIKTLNGLVEAEATLVVETISQINVGLTLVSETKCPSERFGNRAGDIADRIDAGPAAPGDRVTIRTKLQREMIVFAEYV